jgi:hypothetical protein
LHELVRQGAGEAYEPGPRRDPVRANTSSGNATDDTAEPSDDTTCPLHRRR